MKNRIGPQSIRRDVPHTSVSNPDTTSAPQTTDAPRSSRSLYAEARRYESAARNLVDGRYDGIDSDGRQWTVDEMYRHASECRRAGDSAYAAERKAAETAAQIGPREPGTVYDNASGAFRVLAVVTDPSEVRRILRRNAAKFAILVRDLHAGSEHYTGAVWTGSDRVLKVVA